MTLHQAEELLARIKSDTRFPGRCRSGTERVFLCPLTDVQSRPQSFAVAASISIVATFPSQDRMILTIYGLRRVSNTRKVKLGVKMGADSRVLFGLQECDGREGHDQYVLRAIQTLGQLGARLRR